jgi:RNA polymerase sigma-70 factor (ECF subfamily)
MKPALVIVPDDPAPAGGGGADELALVAAAQHGDRVAFGRLYERHAAMVHGVLLAQVPHAEVEDLVQDVFMQAMRKLPALRDPSAFAPWLAAIARNRAMDRHRARRPARAAADAAEVAHEPATTEARTILAVIQELPLAYRETLVLRLVEGMTGPEIAARTGLTPESVRVNLHRGMKKLRERLDNCPSTAREHADE